jgi:hypothetical protein
MMTATKEQLSRVSLVAASRLPLAAFGRAEHGELVPVERRDEIGPCHCCSGCGASTQPSPS